MTAHMIVYSILLTRIRRAAADGPLQHTPIATDTHMGIAIQLVVGVDECLRSI